MSAKRIVTVLRASGLGSRASGAVGLSVAEEAAFGLCFGSAGDSHPMTWHDSVSWPPDAADQLRIIMGADFTIQPLLNKDKVRSSCDPHCTRRQRKVNANKFCDCARPTDSGAFEEFFQGLVTG